MATRLWRWLRRAIVKNIIMLPIETALLYVILKQVSALRLPSRNYSA